MKRILAISIVCAVALAGFPARAADTHGKDSCRADFEQIFKMKEPEYAASPIWTAPYGEPKAQETFIGGISLESGETLAIGARTSADSNDTDLLLIAFDMRGRVAREDVRKVAALSSVRAIAEGKKGFVVMGQYRPKKGHTEIWLGFFDLTGRMLNAKTIHDAKFDLEPRAITVSRDGEYYAAVSAVEKTGSSHAIIYRLDKGGRVISAPAYLTGSDNEMLSLAPAGADRYIAGGFMRGDDGRKNGWMVGLNKDLSIAWQRAYPRGRAAQVNAAVDYGGAYILAAGETQPAGGGRSAGWAMMLDGADGNIIWQRYFTGAPALSARDILISKDGVSTFALDAQRPEGSADAAFARLITLDPRGAVLANEEFQGGQVTHAGKLLAGGSGERIILGSIEQVRRVEKPAEKMGPPAPAKKDEPPATVRGLDGWLMAALPAKPYKDPCAKPTEAAP